MIGKAPIFIVKYSIILAIASTSAILFASDKNKNVVEIVVGNVMLRTMMKQDWVKHIVDEDIAPNEYLQNDPATDKQIEKHNAST